MKRHRWLCGAIVGSVFLFTACLRASAEDNWNQFRGPNQIGHSDATGLPGVWGTGRNVIWQVDLPGAGTSSPVVWGDRVFVTCYSGYGLSEDDPGDQSKLMRHVVCVGRLAGNVLWKRDFKPLLPESRYAGNGARHGYASSTPVADAEHVYVFFGKSGVYCLDHDGNQQWHVSVGTGIHNWGSAASLRMYRDLIIVNASVESRSLVALNKSDGRVVWKVEGIRGAWNTPVLVPVGDRHELVVCVPQRVLAFDPETGEKLWECEGIPDRGYVVPSVVYHDGIVYAIGGRQNTALAVRAGGRGDVTGTHLLWKVSKGSNVASPVYHDGHLYWVHERRGVAYCLDAKTGEVVYEKRLEPRPGIVYSAMLYADGKLYCTSQYEGTFVLAARPQFALLARNVFTDDDSRCNASPIVSGKQLLFRSDKRLYCIGGAP